MSRSGSRVAFLIFASPLCAAFFLFATVVLGRAQSRGSDRRCCAGPVCAAKFSR